MTFWVGLTAVLLISPVRADPASQAYESGHFAEAASAWGKAACAYLLLGDRRQAAEALADEAAAEENIGDYPAAVKCMDRCVALEGTAQQKLARAESYILARSDLMGMSYLEDRDPDDPDKLRPGRAERILQCLAQFDPNVIEAYASLYLAQGKFKCAADKYEESWRIAEKRHDRPLMVRAAENAALAYLADARRIKEEEPEGPESTTQPGYDFDIAACRRMNDDALTAARTLPCGHVSASSLLVIGQTYQGLFSVRVNDNNNDPSLLHDAYLAYQRAIDLASPDDEIIRSYVFGYTGHIYEIEGRRFEAEELTSQAMFLAQRLQLPNVLYLWQWQMGRLLSACGDRERAIQMYDSAVASLDSIRIDFAFGGGSQPGSTSFRDTAGNVYYELADLLLQTPNVESCQNVLAKVRETVEKLKIAQLANYFQDRCDKLLEEKRSTIDALDSNTAVVYYIPLQCRLEILVGVAELQGGKPVQKDNKSVITLYPLQASVAASRLNALVGKFCHDVRISGSEQYYKEGRQLYGWLVSPVDRFLTHRLNQRHIDTLVFVPDGRLAALPMAALADDQDQPLIMKYAIAISPGLNLTESRDDESLYRIASGARVLVGAHTPTSNVCEIIHNITSIYGHRADILQNGRFDLADLQSHLLAVPYTIVHIASDGHFGGSPSQTYIVTDKNNLTLNDLEALIKPSAYRSHPVDLLAFSACDTAMGDDRSALGFAGVAVKAGALAAMATLWEVDADSSTKLVNSFYCNVAKSGMTKARALQLAQRDLLRDNPDFNDPYFWAGFEIIGNWL
jgi:CHAT domain-containing protein